VHAARASTGRVAAALGPRVLTQWACTRRTEGEPVGLNPVADVLKRADKVLKSAEVALGNVDTTLGTVGTTLADVDAKLSTVDTTLAETRAVLGQVEQLLGDLNDKLVLLDEVPDLKAKLDAVLAAVRAG